MTDAELHARLVELGLYGNPRNLGRHLKSIFGDVNCAGRTVLDIGGGVGLLSLAAVHRGARRAILLEPEADGSSEGMNARFRRAASSLEVSDRVELRLQTFQDFDPGDLRFDLVLSHNSINHLEEQACADLQRSADARRTYLELLHKLRRMLEPGADVIVCDCARRNFFGDLGLRNPITPAIEWHKHQSPRLWAELFEEAGFERRSIRWNTFNSLGWVGKALLSNGPAAYLSMSHFRLAVTRT